MSGPALGERLGEHAGGAGPGSMRQHNLSLVLRTLSRDGPRSRAALADATGITKATVSKLVADLVDRGIVRDATTRIPIAGALPTAPTTGTGPVSPAARLGRAGRPGTPVEISDERVVAIGLAMDVDSMSGAAIDLCGGMHHLRTVVADNRAASPRRTMRRLAALAEDLMAKVTTDGCAIAGTTVAVPGLVAAGRVLVAPNLGWNDIDLAGELASLLPAAGGTIRVDNEATLAALAESQVRHGGPGDERTFVYVSAGVGVGAGVVIDGEVYRGAHGFGGEFGHFVVDESGETCRCGNRGCIETIVGSENVRRLIGSVDGSLDGSVAGRKKDDASNQMSKDEWVERFVAAAWNDDERAIAALDEISRALASGLASTVSLVDPEAIVLGGFLTDLTPWLAPAIEDQLRARVLGSRFVAYPVRPSRLGSAAPLIGAGRESLRPVLANPLLVPVRPT